MNVYLIGMMGSGKTVTGKRLAVILNQAFTDLDACVEKKSGQAIAEIFESRGEEFFRDLETQVLREEATGLPRIIATGGGIILRPGNVSLMRSSGKIVYLETGIEWLWQRVRGRSERPLLRGRDPRAKLEDILSARRVMYEQSCDLRVVTDGRSAESVAEEIAQKLEKKE